MPSMSDRFSEESKDSSVFVAARVIVDIVGEVRTARAAGEVDRAEALERIGRHLQAAVAREEER